MTRDRLCHGLCGLCWHVQHPELCPGASTPQSSDSTCHICRIWWSCCWSSPHRGSLQTELLVFAFCADLGRLRKARGCWYACLGMMALTAAILSDQAIHELLVLFVHLGALSLEGLQLLEPADHVPEVWLEIGCIALPLIEGSVVALAGSQELSVKEITLVDLVLLLPAQRLPLRVLLVCHRFRLHCHTPNDQPARLAGEIGSACTRGSITPTMSKSSPV
ncbi:unnamed protein product [Vitrella brassicaformis CCMP3155]|uniref:Uncharacterized protein n=1 Tax=Vitrella brassicaformis (strain CCMP3155) TaxID=1169540 RepID=A0A0G4GRK9_VITBC|nr:unnamed protein product [Vitrella brassicaformis CCMP3155]|eukprot:CEM33202.1 unnamed protein product [Vitrella brassicaformis CCMP3155]